jgi:hypothetical protein
MNCIDIQFEQFQIIHIKSERKFMPTAAEILAQSLRNAVLLNDLNYILWKRKNKAQNEIPALHPRDSFAIFAMLDKFLGGDGLSDKKDQFWDEDAGISIVDDQKFEDMLGVTPSIPENRKEKWTIIVFSETFFFDTPFDDAELEYVMRYCRLLSGKYPKLVISANFLHKYQGVARSRDIPLSDDFISGNGNPGLHRNRASRLRFSNCTFIVWSGVPISIYRKTTHTAEADDLVAAGYGYDFGDWKSRPTTELQAASNKHKEIAKLFNSGKKQVVAARTCSDMNFTPKLPKHVKLLILTANDSSDAIYWQDKTKQALVCVSDADRGGFFVANNTRPIATIIDLGLPVFNEWFCILAVDYGSIHNENEVVDVGCCECCN